MEKLGFADEMYHGYRWIDAPSDAVKLELFVEIAGLPKASYNVRRTDPVGIRTNGF